MDGNFAGFLLKVALVAGGGSAMVVEALHRQAVLAATSEWIPIGVGGVAFLAVVAARLLSQWRADRTYEAVLAAATSRAKDAENREAMLRWDDFQLRAWAYDHGWDGSLKPMPPGWLPWPDRPNAYAPEATGAPPAPPEV